MSEMRKYLNILNESAGEHVTGITSTKMPRNVKENEVLQELPNQEIQDFDGFEKLDELEEIRNNMDDELRRAGQIIQEICRHYKQRMPWERAKSYWYAHAKMALMNDHGYLGSSSVSFEDTIEELRDVVDEKGAEERENQENMRHGMPPRQG